MEIISYNSKESEMSISKSELIILINILNEVLREIEPWEYGTRIGVESSCGVDLVKEFSSLLNRIP
jgi:hypothetical protein